MENDAYGCNGRYLSYKKQDNSTRVYLGSASATYPRTWTLQQIENDHFKFYTDKRSEQDAAKLAYSTSCSSTYVKVMNNAWRRWRVIAVDELEGLYRIVAINKKTKCDDPYFGRLSPKAAVDGESCSVNNELTLLPVDKSTRSMLWKFTPVKGPPPSPVTPTPPSGPIPCASPVENPIDGRERPGELDCTKQANLVVSGQRLSSSSLSPCGYETNVTNADECCLRCQNNANCFSWMFTTPLNCFSLGIEDLSSACYLMSDYTGSYSLLPEEVDLTTISGSYFF